MESLCVVVTCNRYEWSTAPSRVYEDNLIALFNVTKLLIQVKPLLIGEQGICDLCFNLMMVAR